MSRKEFAKDLEKRTRQFAVRIIKISAKLPNTVEGRVVRNQLTKAGTSVIFAHFKHFNFCSFFYDHRSPKIHYRRASLLVRT